MKSLVLTLAVSPDFQGQGYGLALGRRTITLSKQRGATHVVGLIMDDSTKAYVESLGFSLRNLDLNKGFCDIPNINNIPNQGVPGTVNEVLKDVLLPQEVEEWLPEDDPSVTTTFLAWYEKGTGRAVAKARFKVF